MSSSENSESCSSSSNSLLRVCFFAFFFELLTSNFTAFWLGTRVSSWMSIAVAIFSFLLFSTNSPHFFSSASLIIFETGLLVGFQGCTLFGLPPPGRRAGV
eukprot:Lithocolla_globosa_v1_NODE_970_length_3007_cov_25.984417.p5 type:complete len:101 gc:universal NODE_970_length_3007_cov_25.984417:2085-2387(+)